MSQKEMKKENSQKAVLAQIQNQAIIVTSQGEVKSQLQAESQDRVPSQVQDSQASSCVASQGQVLTQAQLASQPNVSSQDRVGTQAENVSSQPTVPTRSQSSSQSAVSSRKRNSCQRNCCPCCKEVPVLEAKKAEWRRTAGDILMTAINSKKQNE